MSASSLTVADQDILAMITALEDKISSLEAN
jgi:hypothetical protein